MKQAAIFDLDGVIVDTARFHYLAWKKAYSRALERVTGRKVFRRVLWFFATGQLWEL